MVFDRPTVSEMAENRTIRGSRSRRSAARTRQRTERPDRPVRPLPAHLPLPGALATALAEPLRPCSRPRKSSSREVLRRRAEGPERLRRRPGHHLRRHLEGRLPGQCLEVCPKGTCTTMKTPKGTGSLRAIKAREVRVRRGKGAASIAPASSDGERRHDPTHARPPRHRRWVQARAFRRGA